MPTISDVVSAGGNPWLGLVHGCTGRLGWQGDPRAVWKAWDDFGVADSEFIGWWAGKENPVQTNNPAVKATVWKKKGRTLLALGNFDAAQHRVKLTVDWGALGLSEQKAKMYAPAIPPLQAKAALYSARDTLSVPGHKGLLLWIDEQARAVTAVEAGVSKAGAILHEQTFATVPPNGWKTRVSDKVAAGSIRADNGLVLTIPANTHAWFESELPRGTTGVSASVWQDPQDDAQQWGPGIAIVWSGGDVLKVSRRRDGRVAIARNGTESFPASLAETADVTLEIHWDEKEVRVVAGGPAMLGIDEEVAKFPRSQFGGNPTAARLGKMSAKADTADHSAAGPVGYTRFAWFRVHGRAIK